MNDPVVPFDLMRMLLGRDPALFYLEIVLRTCVIYGFALVLIRWVGGRGIAQMSTVEFLLVIALGSAVGDAMFYPEVPILHAMLVIALVVVINKAIDTLIFRYRPLEKAVDGSTWMLVRDGVVDQHTLRCNKLGRSEVFEGLRVQGYRNLGQIGRAYLETSGRFSVFPAAQPVPGLPIEPAWDCEPPPIIGPRRPIIGLGPVVCGHCGKGLAQDAGQTPDRCDTCAQAQWTRAILVRPDGGPADQT